MWRHAALCAVWAVPCGAVRRHVPSGQRRAALCAVWAAPCGAMRRRADAVRAPPCGAMLRRAAPCAPCVPCGNAARRVACRVACRAAFLFPRDYEACMKGSMNSGVCGGY
eukprot:gene12680-biopygen2428